MRCKHCGWPNKPNETVCVKCHKPLDVDSSPADSSYSSPAGNDDMLKKTVREDIPLGGGSSDRQQAASYGESRESPQSGPQNAAAAVCPKCGYPLRPGTDKCPNCKFDVTRTAPESSGQSSGRQAGYNDYQESRRRTRLASGSSSGKFAGTVINPYLYNPDVAPYFRLRPIKWQNERHELSEVEYDGKEVILNRENTDSNNPTITSKQQAVVTREGDSWFIQDRSEQQTTFVRAAGKIELHDGDIILLGNRLFEFHEQ